MMADLVQPSESASQDYAMSSSTLLECQGREKMQGVQSVGWRDCTKCTECVGLNIKIYLPFWPFFWPIAYLQKCVTRSVAVNPCRQKSPPFLSWSARESADLAVATRKDMLSQSSWSRRSPILSCSLILFYFFPGLTWIPYLLGEQSLPIFQKCLGPQVLNNSVNHSSWEL